ncbi:MAG TPA: type II secretion system F family protein [Egibacteraceae bacterium]|jgi:tight adherence protein C|nr:type II secretion system F family protein [Egibacteraceae bacterium]
MSPILGYVGALAVGAGLALVVGGLRRSTPGRVALSTVTGGDDPIRSSRDLREEWLRQGLLERVVRPTVERFARAGRRITPWARSAALRERLDNAGYAAPVESFLAVKMASVGAGLVLAVAYAALGGARPLVALVVAAVAGYALPELVVHSQGQKRQEAISRTLPEALDLLALTVQAGLGFEQGVAEVTEEVTGPLATELDRMLKEQQLGRSRREALVALHERNRSEELRALVSALLHADRLGTPIADTLRVQARELRRRRRALARERAGKAPVKLLFPLLFGIFPAMFVVIIGPGALRIIEALIR